MGIAGYTAARAELHRLVNGYQVSQALHVLTGLGIPDRLADGPCSSKDLAALVGASRRTALPVAAGSRRNRCSGRVSGTPLCAHRARRGPTIGRVCLTRRLGRICRTGILLGSLVPAHRRCSDGWSCLSTRARHRSLVLSSDPSRRDSDFQSSDELGLGPSSGFGGSNLRFL